MMTAPWDKRLALLTWHAPLLLLKKVLKRGPLLGYGLLFVGFLLLLFQRGLLLYLLLCLGICIVIVEHHGIPKKLCLNEALDYFRVDYRHTLRRAPVYLLLHRNLLGFMTFLPGDVYFHGLRASGECKQLIQIELCELVANQC